jgi:hypothetical protein
MLTVKIKVHRETPDWDMAVQAIDRKVGSLNDSLISCVVYTFLFLSCFRSLTPRFYY